MRFASRFDVLVRSLLRPSKTLVEDFPSVTRSGAGPLESEDPTTCTVREVHTIEFCLPCEVVEGQDALPITLASLFVTGPEYNVMDAMKCHSSI